MKARAGVSMAIVTTVEVEVEFVLQVSSIFQQIRSWGTSSMEWPTTTERTFTAYMTSDMFLSEGVSASNKFMRPVMVRTFPSGEPCASSMIAIVSS